MSEGRKVFGRATMDHDTVLAAVADVEEPPEGARALEGWRPVLLPTGHESCQQGAGHSVLSLCQLLWCRFSGYLRSTGRQPMGYQWKWSCVREILRGRHPCALWMSVHEGPRLSGLDRAVWAYWGSVRRVSIQAGDEQAHAPAVSQDGTCAGGTAQFCPEAVDPEADGQGLPGRS